MSTAAADDDDDDSDDELKWIAFDDEDEEGTMRRVIFLAREIAISLSSLPLFPMLLVFVVVASLLPTWSWLWLVAAASAAALDEATNSGIFFCEGASSVAETATDPLPLFRWYASA